MSVKVVILAGGSGTRFWPMSRSHMPKQFLPLGGGEESLLQATVRRVAGLDPNGAPLIVTAAHHVGVVRSQVPACSVIGEPVGKNTATSIGLGALWARRMAKDAVMVVLAADPSVKNEVLLRSVLHQAATVAAASDVLVTVGITPTSPHTGYGYIKRGDPHSGGAFHVARFYEKPNLDRATQYLESGDFLWNSGMFAWRASSILTALETFMPDLYRALMEIDKALGTPREGDVLASVFPTIEGTSIDFGVLEHARNCVVIPTEGLGWSDIGAWDSWAEQFPADTDGNFIKGEAVAVDVRRSVVVSQSRVVALVGCEDIVVVDTPDALLVAKRSHLQDVKKVVDELKRRGRTDVV